LLYALTIFLGVFLLFLVHPIIVKQILPWFGGSASAKIRAGFLSVSPIYLLTTEDRSI
jgi:hypothetical protein